MYKSSFRVNQFAHISCSTHNFNSKSRILFPFKHSKAYKKVDIKNVQKLAVG